MDGFEGTIVAVSHDRAFLRCLDRFLLLDADGVVTAIPDPGRALATGVLALEPPALRTRRRRVAIASRRPSLLVTVRAGAASRVGSGDLRSPARWRRRRRVAGAPSGDRGPGRVAARRRPVRTVADRATGGAPSRRRPVHAPRPHEPRAERVLLRDAAAGALPGGHIIAAVALGGGLDRLRLLAAGGDRDTPALDGHAASGAAGLHARDVEDVRGARDVGIDEIERHRIAARGRDPDPRTARPDGGGLVELRAAVERGDGPRGRPPRPVQARSGGGPALALRVRERALGRGDPDRGERRGRRGCRDRGRGRREQRRDHRCRAPQRAGTQERRCRHASSTIRAERRGSAGRRTDCPRPPPPLWTFIGSAW